MTRVIPALSDAKVDRRRGHYRNLREKFIAATAQALQEELRRTEASQEANPARAIGSE